MPEQLLQRIGDYLVMGGLVMPALLGVGLLLWVCLGLRLHLLQRGFSGGLVSHLRRLLAAPKAPARARGLVDAVAREGALAVCRLGRGCREHLDLLVLRADRELSRFRRGIRSLCGAAPLLGLLGTVGGMVETFSSMTELELFSQSGGVAGGISEALITTQLGLLVGIPGVVVGRLLEQREEALRREVRRARELLAEAAARGAGEAA